MNEVTPDLLLPWMIFPAHEELRERYAARQRIMKCIKEQGDTISGIAKNDLLLVMSIAVAVDWDSKIDLGVQQGSVAGALLGLVHDQYATGANEPSINKAVAIYQDFALGKRYGLTEKPLPYSRQTILSCWYTARPVAHYWAALELAKTESSPYAVPRDRIFHSPPDFCLFVEQSRIYADFAKNFIPKRSKPPLPLVTPQEQVRVGLL